MDKKMKRASVGFDQSHVTDDGAKAKFKYQTLLKEYLELQKEFVSRKRKLQAAKQKRETTLAEVRFLRRKRNYLSKSQAFNIEKLPLHLPNSDQETNALQGGRNQSTSEAAPNSFDLVSNLRLKNEEEEGNAHEKDVRLRKKLKNRLLQDESVGLTWIGSMGDQEAPWARSIALGSGTHLRSVQMVEPTS